MDALWNLEDKWKPSTQQALLLLSFTAAAVVGLCAAAWIKTMKAQKKERTTEELSEARRWPAEHGGWVSVKRVLVGSVRWSKPSKWAEERGSRRWCRERPAPLLGGDGEVGFHSHNSTSPVWQRPILMGEKCELPKYSGLILYDERGRLLHDGSYKEMATMENGHREEEAVEVKTRLKDLL